MEEKDARHGKGVGIMRKKSKKDIFISVVIPAHNEEEDIHDALKSVIDQSYKNYEMILVNDGSTDRTKEIIESYMKKTEKIKLINFDEGHSCAFACDAGIDAAKGEVILCIPSDIVVEKDFLKKVADGYKNYDIQGLAWRTKAYKPKTWISKAYAARRNVFPDHLSNEKKVYGKDLPFLFSCWRADVLRKLGGMNSDVFYFEDVDLSTRFKEAGNKVLFDPDIKVYHKDPDKLKPFIRQSKWISKGLKVLIRVYPKKALKIILTHLLKTMVFLSPLLYLLSFFGFPIFAFLGAFGAALLVLMILAGTFYIYRHSKQLLYSFLFMLMNVLRSPVCIFYLIFGR